MSGWYEAEVQSFDYDDDEVELVYADETGCVCAGVPGEKP